MNKSKLSVTMLITIIILLVGSILFFQKFYQVDSKVNSEIDTEIVSNISIKQLILPEIYTYIDSGFSDINVEYSTDNYIEIIFNSEIINTEEVKVSLLQTGSYVHLKKENEENIIYQHDNLYEVTNNAIKIIPSDFHRTLPGGFLKININNINSKNISLYCTTTTFNNITLLKERLNYTNDEKPSMLLPKTNKDNKKIAYITEDTELLDENGNIICNLYLGDNIEIINENTNYCTIYYPNLENINKIKTINEKTDIYNSQYVDKFSGYIKNNTFKIIPAPKNDNNIVEIYLGSTGFDAIPVISVTSPFMGYNKYEEITNNNDITSDCVSKLEDELLIVNKVFMLPTSYWVGYTINGEKLENLDPRSQPYILNLSEGEYKYIRNYIIEYYNFLEEKWKNTVVSSDYVSRKELTIEKAKKYIDFELCWLDWIAIDRMNDLNKFADRVYEKLGNPNNKERLYHLLTNLDKDYSNNMSTFTNEFIVNYNKIIKPTDEEVIELYKKAQEIYLWFAETVPYEKIDYKNSIEDGVYLIKDERFSTLKELKEYMAEIFTVEIIGKIEEERFDTNLIFEMDGKLYMSEYVTPKNIYYGKEKIKDIKYIDDNTITLTISVEILNEKLYTVKGEEEHTFILIYSNGEWKFSKFYCIGFYL